jgi:hypothetical protein
MDVPPRPPPGNPRPARDVDSAPDSPAVAEALQRSCTRLTDNLRDTFGAEGCSALLSRSLGRVNPPHQALASIRRDDGREIFLDRVPAAVEQHGLPAVEAAVAALREALLEVLGRLIGKDMAMRIIDLPEPSGERREGTP